MDGLIAFPDSSGFMQKPALNIRLNSYQIMHNPADTRDGV